VKYNKEIVSLENFISGLKKRLENKNFLEKASREVIDKENQKLKEAEEKYSKLKKMM
jgi:valyl-tRNA synthetase